MILGLCSALRIQSALLPPQSSRPVKETQISILFRSHLGAASVFSGLLDHTLLSICFCRWDCFLPCARLLYAWSAVRNLLSIRLFNVMSALVLVVPGILLD